MQLLLRSPARAPEVHAHPRASRTHARPGLTVSAAAASDEEASPADWLPPRRVVLGAALAAALGTAARPALADEESSELVMCWSGGVARAGVEKSPQPG